MINSILISLIIIIIIIIVSITLPQLIATRAQYCM